MVASEAAPFAKTGGLADVVGSLPKALSGQGVESAVVMPRYGSISLDGAHRVWERLVLSLGMHSITCDIWRQDYQGIPFFFIDCPWLFDRPGIYNAYGQDYGDNYLRFATLCQGALGTLRFLYPADVLHVHDWQAALAAAYLKTRHSLDPALRGVKVVFTIHNLEHQGRFGPHVFRELALDSWLMEPGYLEYFGDVNFLKAGILFSDAITTVSPRYAEEIQTPEFGCGLDGLLRQHKSRLRGILNGVDYTEWDPATDPLLPARYSERDLSGKGVCKRYLKSRMGVDGNGTRPLVGFVSRFARQKGFDMLAEILPELLDTEDVNMVFIGSGERRYEDFFSGLAPLYPGRVSGVIGYDNELAHQLEAGVDVFLMPSLFEPCGLNQMYSLRYGTPPVVRATGGLDDTVDAETGFKFSGYNPRDLLASIRQALAEYGDTTAWKRRMRAGMARDFSWNASAARYAELYRDLARSPVSQ